MHECQCSHPCPNCDDNGGMDKKKLVFITLAVAIIVYLLVRNFLG